MANGTVVNDQRRWSGAIADLWQAQSQWSQKADALKQQGS